jgi:hypothetical protein
LVERVELVLQLPLPVIRHRFKWQRASMAAGLGYCSRDGGAQLASRHQVGASTPIP